MPDERMVRGSERNKLLEEIMSKISRLEYSVYLGLAEVIIKYLESKQTGKLEPERRDEVTKLFNSIIYKVKSFARADEEANFLYAELLKKVLNLALIPFYNALLGLEIRNPELIFGSGPKMTGQ